MIYLDTSVLAPFYWNEALTEKVEALFLAEVELSISHLVEVELIPSLSLRVRMGEIAQASAQAIVQRFGEDIRQGLYKRVELDVEHFNQAQRWLGQFTTPLRTLDALHLAIVQVKGMRLVTADVKLAESARFFGVAVQDLNSTEN